MLVSETLVELTDQTVDHTVQSRKVVAARRLDAVP